jgi:quinol monooxygenase YgiN
MKREYLQIVARIVARPDHVNEVRALLQSLQEPTRRETGCISYELLQNKNDPTDFTFVEEWEREADLDAHLASDHIKAALTQLPDLVAETPDIRRYHLVG